MRSERATNRKKYIDILEELRELGLRNVRLPSASVEERRKSKGRIARSRRWQQRFIAWIYGIDPTVPLSPGRPLPPSLSIQRKITDASEVRMGDGNVYYMAIRERPDTVDEAMAGGDGPIAEDLCCESPVASVARRF